MASRDAAPSAAPAPAAPATAPRALGVAVRRGPGFLVGFLVVRLGLLVLGGGLLLERRPLYLGLDLVAQLEVPGVVLLGRELVAAPELAQLRGGNVELVRDPGVGAALADPGANLVEL